jgi:hypothetical protein
MPPEIPTELRVVCCKSQDISSGIMQLGKIRFEFGSRIAIERAAIPGNWLSGDLARRVGVRGMKHAFQALLLAGAGASSESAAGVR